uniref:Uncharacterized protein n=1 Tax=Moniliophthora roreri TaxID=221103 RepID=A0A0W0FTB2_MONRR
MYCQQRYQKLELVQLLGPQERLGEYEIDWS